MTLQYALSELDDRDIAMVSIDGILDFESRNDFKRAMDKVVETGHEKVVVDLSRIESMSTLYIGSLMDLGKNLGESGKSLSIILTGTMFKMCEQVGLDRVATLIPRK